MTTTDFIAPLQTVFADIQDKAKAAYEKGTASFGEANAFTKGNVEAVVTSGKILAEGLQKLGADFVTESRTSFDTLSAEAKELAAAKSPADFFRLQSELLRKHFDEAVAYSSKQGEAFFKLGSESFAPIASRLTLAAEKIKTAA